MTWLEELFRPGVLANLIVAAAAIWYTIETQKLRRTAADQLEAMKNQIKRMETQIEVANKVADQAKNDSFLQLFPIIERHHSTEIAGLRRFAREELAKKCDVARSSTPPKKLKALDPCAAKKASDVANYYESLGMLIEHGDKKLLPAVEGMLLDMVKVSAHNIWEIFYDNIDVIHDDHKKLGTWAGSFEKLYFKIAKHDSALEATKPKLDRA